MATTKKLPIDKILAEGGTQTRAELRVDTVIEYAEAMLRGDEFPPVDVFHDAKGNYWLADGFHRHQAAVRAESDSMLANVHEGELRDAIWFALSANTTNGIRRTNADKRRCVMIALGDKEWSSMSDRAIADHLGVGYSLVSDVRSELTDSGSCEEPKRTGKDGKKRKKPKRKPKPEPVEVDEPDDEPEEIEEQDHQHGPSADTKDQARAALAELDACLQELGIDCDKEIAAIRIKLMKH